MYFLFLLSVSVAATPWWEMYFSFSTLILLHLPFYLNSVRNFLLNSSSLSFPVSFILSLHNFFFTLILWLLCHSLLRWTMKFFLDRMINSICTCVFDEHEACCVWCGDVIAECVSFFFIECMQWKRISELRSSFRLNIRLYCCPY